jgi:hypothetical protein
MTHPYLGAAPHRLWRKAVAQPAAETDPVIDFPFQIGPEDKVCTAGSCFAQHISQRLRESGFAFLVTESAHPILPVATAERFNYGRFTARYGNLYTARQLLQLIQRAYGRFTPVEDVWEQQDGSLLDPFRPQIQPGGFPTRREYELDRAQHFAAVRRAFEAMDVFVFTLGLTESWESRRDGAVFPVCPGTAGGRFDPDVHVFRNHTVEEVAADLGQAILELRALNPAVKIVLTVSPVPLVATATDTHVLSATTYSKSVLRVAAGMLAARVPEVAYFPSYEVITGPQARGRYFAEDLRSITQEGVDRVMSLFFRHATDGRPKTAESSAAPPADPFLTQMRAAVDALCDEEMLDPGD